MDNHETENHPNTYDDTDSGIPDQYSSPWLLFDLRMKSGEYKGCTDGAEMGDVGLFFNYGDLTLFRPWHAIEEIILLG